MIAIFLLWIMLWGLRNVLCNTSLPQSAWRISYSIVDCSQDNNERRFWSYASRLHIYNNVKFTTHRLSCHGQVKVSRGLIFILKNWKGNNRWPGNVEKGTLLSKEFVSGLQHCKMPIWIWFKREYWCLIKFTFTNQSEVQGCQSSWLAHRPVRGNWEDTVGWFTRWGALGEMYQDQF